METKNLLDCEPYLKIVNSLLGAIINSKNLMTNDGKVFMVILFKTLGFQKEKDWLSYKQICSLTGIKQKTRISETIRNLTEKNLIIKDGKYYKVNTDFDTWLCLDGEDKNSVGQYYSNKKLRNSVTNDDKKLRNIVTGKEEKLHNIVTEVTEKRNSKLRNSVTPSTDNIITDKTITDNNKIYSKDDPKKQKDHHIAFIEEIISYLNIKADKNFRISTRGTVKNIRARLKEGFLVDDFKKVIDTKVWQWKDNKDMNIYLRPQTLFGDKFESYLNEKISGENHGRAKKFSSERIYSDEEHEDIERRFTSKTIL